MKKAILSISHTNYMLRSAGTERYIRERYADIKAHASDIEKRADDSYCTPEQLKADNRAVIEGFAGSGEKVVLIDGDYERVVAGIIEQSGLSD